MQLTASTKSHGGFTVAVVALVTLIGVGTTEGVGVPYQKAAIVSVLISFAGLVVWIIGRLQQKPPTAIAGTVIANDVEDPSERFFDFLKLPAYWGSVLCLSALLLGVYSVIQAVRHWPRPAPPIQHLVVPPPIPRPEVPLPKLTLEGLVEDGDNSSALINGRVLRLGEKVEGAQLVKVDETGVWVEFEGQTHQLSLKP